MQIKRDQYFWKIILISGITLFILNSIIFVILGQVNADEGWYLYASKLVYEGQSPYYDFAFTQTPLLPYVYGITQNLFFQSIYMGRITSVFFSIFAFFLSLLIARNYGGDMASGITSLLGATFTFGVYFQSITKTYALTTFFFMLTFFILSSKFKQNFKIILSVVFVLLATLTRLSAAFFAIPFIIYAFIITNTKNRLLIISICFSALLWILILASHNTEAILWGLITHHTSQWGSTPLDKRVIQILSSRIPSLLRTFSQYFLLLITIFSMRFNKIKNDIKHYPEIFIVMVGLLLFSIPNLLSGGFYSEYFVPLIFVLFPIMSIAYTKTLHQKGTYFKVLMNAVIFATMVLGLFRGGFYFIDTSGGQAPINEIRNASVFITENSNSHDKLFALEALWLAVESHRQVMPNMTMAQFSFLETDTTTAKQLHLLNSQTTLNYIDNSIPKMIVLTELDWYILQNTSNYKKIATSLETNYRLGYSVDNFGQSNSHLDIYIRDQGE